MQSGAARTGGGLVSQDSGATAVEIALKIAFQYWRQQGPEEFRRKKKFISLAEAYHGDTIGSVSVGGMA